MAGLLFSEAILFLIAGAGGLALGWRVRMIAAAQERKRLESDLVTLRAALADAHSRRMARLS